MIMARQSRLGETHVLVLPFPVQGHINPMLQFSKRLASKSLRVTLITTSKSMQPSASSVNFESIEFEEGERTTNVDDYLELYERLISKRLAKFIENQTCSQHPAKVLVYDSCMPWALDVAKKFGLQGASFFTQSWAVNAIFYQWKQGTFRAPPEEPVVSLPSMPELRLSDLPSFVCDDSGSYPGLCKLVKKQFSNFEEANWVFCNTYDKLEDEVVQGHINPMLQFAKRLASKGLKVTFITTKPMQSPSTSISIQTIEFPEGEKANGAEEFAHLYKTLVSERLANLIDHLNSSSSDPPKALVYDSFLPWALDVAKQFGLHGASFFTQSWSNSSIYYHLNQGTLKVPLEENAVVSLPSMPVLGINDLPSFVSDTGSYPGLLKMVIDRFSNFQEADWLFCNTFKELEHEVINWMASKWPIKTVGPTIPSMYLDKRLKDDNDYGLHLFKPDSDLCIKWLDSKETDSVVYVSFGSLAGLTEEQMLELSLGLKRSDRYFLWVVREAEQNKLPSNFIEETSERGLVVSWCPQLDVLAHRAVGCFVTHCGWNSTLEALSLGVPMIAMPQWTDQPTNAKFVADVWQGGIRVSKDEKGVVTKEEVERCIREIMEGERSLEIRKNSEKWKNLAKEAVDEGGSSDKNIEEFVAKLLCN
ncbi:UDP-glycosyltransferase 74E2-like [Herrania umbratica]|uniref:UDP-glycosyltransferase 74E2-like n=1 Tax=Herrania umbratica TaxID=108875 RepID=A0A6J1ATF9_9ROSI|nr:UDP-glycosyltransferase 74E2-like [Herrania umbratica]